MKVAEKINQRIKSGSATLPFSFRKTKGEKRVEIIFENIAEIKFDFTQYNQCKKPFRGTSL